MSTDSLTLLADVTEKRAQVNLPANSANLQGDADAYGTAFPNPMSLTTIMTVGAGPALEMVKGTSGPSCHLPVLMSLPTPEVRGQQERQGADTNADKPKKFRRLVPKNDKVIALARLIACKYPKEGSKNAIAKRFTGGNKVEAQSLLRQVRRYKFG